MLGHVDVEEDEVGLHLDRQGEALFVRLGADEAQTLRLETDLEERMDLRRVIHGEHTRDRHILLVHAALVEVVVTLLPSLLLARARRQRSQTSASACANVSPSRACCSRRDAAVVMVG